MNLNEQLRIFAMTFAEQVIRAVTSQSIGELTTLKLNGSNGSAPDYRMQPPARSNGAAPAPRTTSTGRLKRRSMDEIRAAVAQIATLLKRSPGGLRSEQIRKTLGLDVREVPRVLKEALATKAIRILSGQKRSTLYGVAGIGGKPAKGSKLAKTSTASASKKAPKKAASKPAKRPAKKTAPKAKTPKKAARSASAKGKKAARAKSAAKGGAKAEGKGKAKRVKTAEVRKKVGATRKKFSRRSVGGGGGNRQATKAVDAAIGKMRTDAGAGAGATA